MMGREVRRVPPDWQHPKDEMGHYISLYDNAGHACRNCQAEWDVAAAKWAEGFESDYSGGWHPIPEKYRGMSYAEYAGERPKASWYMPDWSDDERTHYQMYESVTEGTPISPVFATPEELARWLADTGASAFADTTASYEAWLATIRAGSSPSMVLDDRGVRSGVEAMLEREQETPNGD